MSNRLPLYFSDVNHALNFFGGAALVVSDGRLPGGLVESRDVQNSVGINVEGDTNLLGSWVLKFS